MRSGEDNPYLQIGGAFREKCRFDKAEWLVNQFLFAGPAFATRPAASSIVRN